MKDLIKFVFIIAICIPHSLSACDEDIIGFQKLGVHHSSDGNGERFAKVFYLSMDFEGNWMHSRSFCKSYDMDLAQFETSYEFSNFLKQAMKSYHLFYKWTHIGGVSKLNEKYREWFWVGKNLRVSYPMIFASGQPNNYLGKQNCLGISKEEKTFEFQDIDCYGRFEEKFICQKVCRFN